MFETLKLEREGALTWVTLDRPERLNAMSRLAMEDRNQILCTRSDDFGEGVRAFLEKRPAKFRDA